MKQRFTSQAIRFVERSGVNAFFRYLNRGSAVILMYHGVCAESFTLLNGYDERHVPIPAFRQQLAVIRNCGYTFVTLSELVARLRAGRSVGRLAVLTFDDGFRNVVRHAYPIMKESGAKGCFFIVSNFIGSHELLWTDLVETCLRARAPETMLMTINNEVVRYSLDTHPKLNRAMMDLKTRLRRLPNSERIHWMEQSGMTASDYINDAPEEFAPADWNELRALDPSILEIGSHTQNHPNCDTIRTRTELEDEIAGSKLEIEKRVGRRIDHFCYPAGAFNLGVIDAVRTAGYLSAVTTIEGLVGPNADLFTLNRISGDSDVMRFKSVVSGSLPWLQRSVGQFRVSP